VDSDIFGTLDRPRLPAHRPPSGKLKQALEAYWDGRSGPEALLATRGGTCGKSTWRRLRDLGLAAVPSNTFSALRPQCWTPRCCWTRCPTAYRELSTADSSGLAGYFRDGARGTGGLAPLPMTKWFDTNYPLHRARDRCRDPVPAGRRQAARRRGTRGAGAGAGNPAGAARSGDVPAAGTGGTGQPRPGSRRRTGSVTCWRCTRALLARLSAEGVAWVQLDEPALVADRTPAELGATGERVPVPSAGWPRAAPAVSSRRTSARSATRCPSSPGSPVEAVGVDPRAGRVAWTARRPDRCGRTWTHWRVRRSSPVWCPGAASGAPDLPAAPRAAAGSARARRRRGGEHVLPAAARPVRRVRGDRPRPGHCATALAFAEQKVTEVVGIAKALPDYAGASGVAPHSYPRFAGHAGNQGHAGAGRRMRCGPPPRRRRAPCPCRRCRVTTDRVLPRRPVTCRAPARAARMAAGPAGPGRVRTGSSAPRSGRVIRLQERASGWTCSCTGEPGAQRHGAVLRGTPGRLRDHPGTAGCSRTGPACTRAAHPARGRAPGRAPITVGWTRYGPSRLTPAAGEGHADRAGDDRRVVLRPRGRTAAPTFVWQVAAAIRAEGGATLGGPPVPPSSRSTSRRCGR